MEGLVSVIIPTYSRPDNILRAIRSVENQTYRDIEIIVVDDNGIGTASQQETQNILSHLIVENKIIYLTHENNKNGSAARNTGVLAAKGDYITFLDDDDEMFPTKIEKQIEKLRSALPSFGGVYCGYEKRDGNKVVSQKTVALTGNLQKEILLQKWGFGTGSNPLFRREVFNKVGLFDVSFKRKQDVEFMVRFFRYYEICCVPDVLVVKYVNSSLNRPSATAYLDIMSHFLETFKNDINNYPLIIQNEIYYVSYMQEAVLAANESQIKLVNKMISNAISYRHLRFHDLLRVIKFFFVNKRIR